MLRLSQWLTLALVPWPSHRGHDGERPGPDALQLRLHGERPARSAGGRRVRRAAQCPAAIGAMLGGGFTTIALGEAPFVLPYGLDANVFGIAMAAIIFLSIDRLMPVGGTRW